jgi:hypothetical protein
LGNREANLLCGFDVDHESAMMTPQLSSLRPSFLALFITVMEMKKSVIYDGKHRRFVKRRGPILLEIELIDASVKKEAYDWFIGEFSSILALAIGKKRRNDSRRPS